jgi:hypothetical protein
VVSVERDQPGTAVFLMSLSESASESASWVAKFRADLIVKAPWIEAPAVAEPGGRFVVGDFVVPSDPSDVVSDLDPDYDTPSSIEEQLQWLSAAGLPAQVVWSERDLAVIAAEHVAV